MKAKANECKTMVAFVAHMCKTHSSDSDHDRWRATTGWALMSYYTDIKRGQRYFTPQELRRLQVHIDTFLTCYNALNSEAQSLR
eukprot:12950639-Alexandrium_andersonii.AAC.1